MSEPGCFLAGMEVCVCVTIRGSTEGKILKHTVLFTVWLASARVSVGGSCGAVEVYVGPVQVGGS